MLKQFTILFVSLLLLPVLLLAQLQTIEHVKAPKTFVGSEKVLSKAINTAPDPVVKLATVPGAVVGYTYYDYMTNGAVGERILNFGDGTLMVGTMAATDFATSDRGTYYNYFNGTSWIDTATIWTRIETARRGWGTIGAFASVKAGVICSHTGVNIAINGSTPESPAWTNQLVTPSNIWPKLAVEEGAGGSYYGIYWTAGRTRVRFTYSLDGGTNWTNKFLADTNAPAWINGYSVNGADDYMIAVRDGKVALANFVTGANVMLYLSADNGTTFTEQTILDAYTHDLNLASYPFDSSFFPAKTYKMLDYSYPDGTGDAHIDAAGKVHLAWGTYQLGYRIVVDTLGAPIRDTVTGKLQRVFFTTDWSLAGIKYWRTGMSAPVTAAVPNASMSDASLMGITGTGVPTTINMGLDVGLTGMPSIGSDAAGNVFIVFQGFKGGDVAANDPATPDDKNPFGHVYAVGSSNGTAWSAPKDIYGTSVVGEDVLYASVADLVDNDLHILVQNDGSPGTWLQQTTHPQNRNYFLYTKVAKSSILTDVRDDEVVTKDFKLGQNYPNPFNPLTHISYTIPSNNLVTLKVFDMLGREVATLVNEVQDAGTHNISFNAKNLASGMYIYTLQAGSFSETKKMMYLK